MHSQLGLWTTQGANTKRGPSHALLGMLNPDGISFNALVRKLNAHDHLNFIFGADRFRRAIAHVPVLLFGITTLRVTYD